MFYVFMDPNAEKEKKKTWEKPVFQNMANTRKVGEELSRLLLVEIVGVGQGVVKIGKLSLRKHVWAKT